MWQTNCPPLARQTYSSGGRVDSMIPQLNVIGSHICCILYSGYIICHLKGIIPILQCPFGYWARSTVYAMASHVRVISFRNTLSPTSWTPQMCKGSLDVRMISPWIPSVCRLPGCCHTLLRKSGISNKCKNTFLHLLPTCSCFGSERTMAVTNPVSTTHPWERIDSEGD